MLRKFPDSPVVRTPHPPCQGPGFDPWSQGRESLMGCCLWGPTESGTTDVTQQQQQEAQREEERGGNSSMNCCLWFR